MQSSSNINPPADGGTSFRASKNADFFNAIANHPGVFPVITEVGAPAVDFAPAWPTLVGFEFEDGGFLLQCHEPGYWEAHTLFYPDPSNVRAKAREVIDFVFTSTDALEIVTKVPVDNERALGLAQAVGFKPRFARPAAWRRFHGAVDVIYLGMTLDDYVLEHPMLPTFGEQFHRRIEAIGHLEHGPDPIHDAYVGAAMACALSNNLRKGVDLYNRWAPFAGYLKVEQVSDTAIAFDNILVEVTAEGTLDIKEVA